MSRFYPKFDNYIPSDVQGRKVERSYIVHFQVSAANAVVGSNTNVLAATALTAATQAIIANITSPTAVRNIKVVGNAAGIAGNVTVKGTNYAGDPISEVIALNGITAVEGVKAFRTITEIDLPIKVNADGDTVSVGFGEKLGLPYKLAHNTILKTYLDNALESTAPTVTVDSANIEGNTIKLNSNLSGKTVDVYLMV